MARTHESLERRGSPLAISSAVLVVLAPLAAWVVLLVTFPGGECGPDFSDHMAVAIFGIYAFLRAASTLFWLLVIGLLAGVVSLVRAEPRRALGVVAISIHALLLVVVLAGVVSALIHMSS